MTDLRDLAAPLLTDPPHAAPPLDELQARVDRRRRRRARTIGLCSVLAVVLVAAGVLALPRDTELRAGDEPTTTVTQPPPPIEAAPIQLVVAPESAPLDAARTVEIRNTATEPYIECGNAYSLYRWDGTAWMPVALVRLGTAGQTVLEVDAEMMRIMDCFTPDPLPPGASRTLGFDPGGARWDPTDGTTPPRQDQLATGWYELRTHPGAQSDLPALGRFQITSPGADQRSDPPPTAATPVLVNVAPESAPLAADRRLEVHNTTGQPFSECGLRFELRRWDGQRFAPTAILYTATEPPFLAELDDPFNVDRCVDPTIVEPGGTTSVAFNPGTTVRRQNGGTIPASREPLAPGWYELANVGTSSSPVALGRFEITDDGAVGSGPPRGPATTATVTDGAAVDGSPSIIDVWPGEPLTPLGTVGPDQLVVVDDDTAGGR